MEMIWRYSTAFAFALFGIAVALIGPMSPAMRGLLFGILAALTFLDVISTRFGHLKVVGLLPPKRLFLRWLVAIGVNVAATSLLIGSLWWLSTRTFAGHDNAFVGSLILGFLLIISLAALILAGALVKIKGSKA